MEMSIPLGIDINGLNEVDKKRIVAIGLWKWMDEICDAAKAPRPALRPSARPHKSRLCKAGKKCLKFGTAGKTEARPGCSPLSILHNELSGVRRCPKTTA